MSADPAAGVTGSADASAVPYPTAFFGHPRGLATLFFTEFWERFSYYGIQALLVLFATASVARGGLGLSVAQGTALYGLYSGSLWPLSLPARWLAHPPPGSPPAPLV